jgi:outer membrane protein OmpA-like peptidoglycan-associated protein
MKQVILPLLALTVLAALAYYLPKAVQQTEGFAPLAEKMAQDVAAAAPEVVAAPEPAAPLSAEPESPPLPVEEPTAPPPPPAADLTPFVEAMAAADYAKAAALLDLLKTQLSEDKYRSLSASVATARQREAAEQTAKAEALRSAEMKAAAASKAPSPSPADTAVLESLKQLQQAQQETAKMLASLSTQQQQQAKQAIPASSPPTVATSGPLPGTTVIQFGRDSSLVDAEQAAKLSPLVAKLQQDSAAKIELRGFADKSGSTDYNLGLSRSRAAAVQDVFRRAGVADSRISLLPMGSFQAGDLPAEQASAMRKVEVLLVK